MANVALVAGNTPVFTVTPVFSGAAFTPVAAHAFVSSSDPVNFPVQLVPTDATGLSFKATIPLTLTTEESITVVWQYHNTDGTTAVVNTSFVIEPAPPAAVDLTGGTIAQTA